MSRQNAILAPSILAGNHARLAESLKVAEDTGARWLHLDIMDGHFVPNLTFGPQTVADLRKESTGLFFDVHLMLDQPFRYIEAFSDAGADLISIHVEPEYDIEAALKDIRGHACQNGIVLNPGTPAEAIEPYLDKVDLVLVMTVQPGFGGQAFREDMLAKIATIHQWRREKGLHFRLEVDGGINLETAAQCADNGADTFVAGSAFFKAEDKTVFLDSIEAL